MEGGSFVGILFATYFQANSHENERKDTEFTRGYCKALKSSRTTVSNRPLLSAGSEQRLPLVASVCPLPRGF